MKSNNLAKKSVVIAALVLSGMAGSQARANGVISFPFTSPSGLLGSTATFGTGNQALVATGYSCINSGNAVLCANNANTNYSANTTALYDNTATSGTPNSGAPATSDGLGVADNTISGSTNGTGYTRQEIPNTQFIQLNFTTILSNYTVTSITFQMTDIVTAWSLYTSSSAGKLQGSGTDLVDNSQAGGTGPIITSFTINNPTSADDLISVIAGTNCDVVLESVTVNYSGNGGNQGTAPEPATLMMTGLALVGLGTIIKKSRKKA